MTQKSTGMFGKSGIVKTLKSRLDSLDLLDANTLQRKYIQMIALLMILLVISLPFTFAAQVSSVSAVGSINAGNVVKQGDQVTVTANISAAAGETIDPTALAQELSVGTKYVFSSCVPSLQTGQFTCTVAFTLDSSLGSAKVNYDVNLYDSAQRTNLVSSKSNSFYIDSVAPIPTISSVQQFGTTVVVSMGATDTAIAGDTSSCSGIAGISLLWRGGGSADQPIPFTLLPSAVGSCSVTNTTSIDISSLPSGVRSLCMVATDLAGNANTVCQSLFLDTSKPALSNVQFSTQFGPTNYIGPGIGTGVMVTFNASNANSGSYTVSVDGTDEGPVTCDVTGLCKTQPFLLSAAKTYSVNVSARTSLGVAASNVASLAIQTDSTPPAFSSLQSDVGSVDSSGRVYFSPGHSLTAHFVENGAGMAGKHAILALGSTTIGAPNNCTQSLGGTGNGWDCVWNSVNFAPLPPQGNLTATITGVSDDLGNKLMTPAAATLFYDDVAPQYDISTLNVTSVGSPSISGVFFSGAIMNIIFNASDSSPLSVVGNFSSFAPSVNTSSGTCANGFCVLQSPQLGIGPATGSVKLMLIDALGNNVSFSTPSYELLLTSLNGSVGNFSHSLTLTPSSLELTTFPYINEHAYAQINVHGIGSAVPLSMALEKCRNIPTDIINTTGGVISTSSGVGDYALLNSAPTVSIVNASQLMLGFTFKATPVNQSNVQFLCDVDVSGRIGDTFIPQEVETVLVNFSTYSLSVGDLGANYQAKLDAQIAKAKSGIGSKLATFEKLFDIATKLCHLWQVLSLVWNTVQTIGVFGAKDVGGHLKASIWTNPIGWALDFAGGNICGVSDVAQVTTDTTSTGIFGSINTVCKYVNCDSSTALNGLVSQEVTSNVGPLMGSIVQAIDPHSTLAGAVVNLCIPGIIQNLRQEQQIECQYALCLRDDVPNGVPVEACDQAYAYSSCVYKTGNIFFIGAFWDKLINDFKSLIADPFALAGTISATVSCVLPCEFPSSIFGAIPTKTCTVVKGVARLGTIAKEIISIKNDWVSQNQVAAQDYCAKLN